MKTVSAKLYVLTSDTPMENHNIPYVNTTLNLVPCPLCLLQTVCRTTRRLEENSSLTFFPPRFIHRFCVQRLCSCILGFRNELYQKLKQFEVILPLQRERENVRENRFIRLKAALQRSAVKVWGTAEKSVTMIVPFTVPDEKDFLNSFVHASLSFLPPQVASLSRLHHCLNTLNL